MRCKALQREAAGGTAHHLLKVALQWDSTSGTMAEAQTHQIDSSSIFKDLSTYISLRCHTSPISI